ncbi:MAG: glycine cleavage system protein R [Pseudomonadota bacterium]|uniref:glycine cleavage system protein R n=1 Tax=Thermithiobacillus tepidarius TaxID=929 RepID=UPI0003FF456F|nr:ACT domain-containing protein [Thermithiobacillus tepidarius]
MKSQAILTVIGQDRPGIVAAVSQALYNAGCSIEDAAMMRLGGYFAIMQVLRYPADLGSVETALDPAVKKLDLRVHLDPVATPLSGADTPPNCRITVFGADHPGIVAHVTGALAEIGFNIIDLESHLSGSSERPVYIMVIQGSSPGGVAAAEAALAAVREQEQVEIRVSPVDTLML